MKYRLDRQSVFASDEDYPLLITVVKLVSVMHVITVVCIRSLTTVVLIVHMVVFTAPVILITPVTITFLTITCDELYHVVIVVTFTSITT